jgi:superfamily II DNA or RNA helicase
MDRIDILPKDEVYIKIECDRGLAQELSDYFTFEVPGAKFMPSYKNRMWDGKIRLFNTASHTLYKGLMRRVEKFCKDRDYECVIHGGLDDINDIHLNDLEEFLKGKYTPRDYQLRAVAHALRTSRALILSPTASGKSFIIYSILKYLLVKASCKKALLIVPTTSLVAQMNADFDDYSSEEPQFYYTHCIMEGQEKNHESANLFISTWQSIYKQPKKWFDQFDVVIGDEAHQFKATSLTKIMTKLDNCEWRFGLTGTLDGTQTNKLVLEGLFGPIMKVIQTKELIDQGTLSDFKIKCLVLKYPESDCKSNKSSTYQDEISFLIGNDYRNNFIKNLAITRTGNTLLLYQMVDKHGVLLYNSINDQAKDRKVFFVHGGVSADDREEIRRIVENEKDAIIVASYGTFSTGINIRNLHNVIFASPSKSRVRNLQSIGRALRKGDSKETATLYDIADDLTYKSRNNHTIKHFAERVKIYNEEEFEYKIYNIKVGNE